MVGSILLFVEQFIDNNEDFQSYYSVRLDTRINIKTGLCFAKAINKLVVTKVHELVTSLFQSDDNY